MVCIHFGGDLRLSLAAGPLLRVAVPCFFMISGYYLVKDGEVSAERVSRQLPKILRLFLVGNIPYVAFYLYERVCSFGDVGKMGEPLFWLKFVVTGCGFGYHFWYFAAYFYLLLLLLVAARRGWMGRLYILAPAAVVACALLHRYSFLLPEAMATGYPGYACILLGRHCMAFPCVLAGAYIRKRTDSGHLPRHLLRIAAAVLTLAYAEYALFTYVIPNTGGQDCGIMTIPLAAAVFLICVRYPAATVLPTVARRGLAAIGSRFATRIYLYHIIVGWTIGILALRLPVLGLLHNAAGIYLATLLLVWAAGLRWRTEQKR